MLIDEKKNILLVEPDTKFANDICQSLSSLNCSVVIEDNMCQAIQKIQNGSAQMVIMEVDLKDIKGYEAIPIIKKIDEKIPIIVMTSNNSRELEKKVREKGVFYYHLKSFGLEDLILAVKNAIKVIEKQKGKQ